MSVALITQARFGSTRLPGKVLKEINSKTLLRMHLENAGKVKLVDHFMVATTNEVESNLIKDEAENCGWKAFQGSTDDVLNRFHESVKEYNPTWVVRITSDCPLVQASLIDEIISEAISNDYDYINTSLDFPDGVDVEVFKFDMLAKADNEAKLLSEREHVTPWIRKQAAKTATFEAQTDIYKNVRLTVDEWADFECMEQLIMKFGYQADWEVYANYVSKNSELFRNQTIIRNEGYLKSIQKDSK